MEMTAIQLISIIQPEHDRTSCSDALRTNGIGSSKFNVYRCRRCVLLDIAFGDWSEDGLPEKLVTKFREEGL